MRISGLRLVGLLLILLPLLLGGWACDDDDDDDDDNDAPDDDDDDNNDDTVADDDDDDDDDNDDDDDDDDYVVPPANNPKPTWPEWALRHWVWEDESTQESAVALVEDYLANDIPVGAIIIDSPWATGYNTFDWDTDDYPDAQVMVHDLHDLGARVFVWITPNMNVDSPLYQEGLENGYYVEDGRTYEWWKGEGSLIDFWNPDAMTWWHGLVDQVLDLGIDGWKCDGSEYQVYLWIGVDTYDGHKSPTEYQHRYYRDFFYYTREQLGDDRIITARPVDSYGIPFWGPNFAPHDVNLAGWVGDQDPNWTGLNAALINMYFSGERGFVNFGSDIGGYRGDDLREKELFVRWAQLGALSPVMENGGAGEHRPWMYDAEVLAIYRDFVLFHHALIPYMYSQGAKYFQDKISVYRPLLKWNWHHMLGDSLLVAPIVTADGGKRVVFPEGTWIDYFTGEAYIGPDEQVLNFPLDRYPVYVKKGDLLPLALGEESVFAAGRAIEPITVMLYPDESHEFAVYEEDGTGAIVNYTMDGGALQLTLSATARKYAFKLMDVDEPTGVTVDPHGALNEVTDREDLQDQQSGYAYDATARTLWIKPGDESNGLIVQVAM